MMDELAEKFPKLTLQACQLPSGEWIVASLLSKPLTQDEAEKVVLAYQTLQELIARGSRKGALTLLSELQKQRQRDQSPRQC
jgi:hypothetical protein